MGRRSNGGVSEWEEGSYTHIHTYKYTHRYIYVQHTQTHRYVYTPATIYNHTNIYTQIHTCNLLSRTASDRLGDSRSSATKALAKSDEVRVKPTRESPVTCA